MIRNGVSAPQVEVRKSILTSLLKKIVPIVGIYLLSNLTIFKGKAFLKPGLTDEQIQAMDLHNINHHKADLVNFMGRGLGAGLALINPDAPAEIEKDEKVGLTKLNELLDLDVVELPSPLKHKHTS